MTSTTEAPALPDPHATCHTPQVVSSPLVTSPQTSELLPTFLLKAATIRMFQPWCSLPRLRRGTQLPRPLFWLTPGEQGSLGTGVPILAPAPQILPTRPPGGQRAPGCPCMVCGCKPGLSEVCSPRAQGRQAQTLVSGRPGLDLTNHRP